MALSGPGIVWYDISCFLKRSLAGARKVLKISRSANVRGTIGGSDRDRDQDLNRSTCIRYYASCRGCHYLIFHPQFHPRTRATPKDPPASPRRGRPLAAQPRWPAGPPPSSLASAPRTTDPAHMATPVAGFGSNAADDELPTQDTSCFNESTICKNLDPTPVRAGA